MKLIKVFRQESVYKDCNIKLRFHNKKYKSHNKTRQHMGSRPNWKIVKLGKFWGFLHQKKGQNAYTVITVTTIIYHHNHHTFEKGRVTALHHPPSSTIINHLTQSPTFIIPHRPSPTIMNHHRPSSTITNHHRPSSTVIHYHGPSQAITHLHNPS